MKTFKHFNSLKIIASRLLVATPLSADDLISEPTEFYNGEIADAADINSNFKIVFDSVRALTHESLGLHRYPRIVTVGSKNALK